MTQLYIEVDKGHTGIMGLVDSIGTSSRFNYVPVTEAEVAFINKLEAAYPEGMIASLSDLEAYRKGQLTLVMARMALTRSEAAVVRAKANYVTVKTAFDTFLDKAAKERGIPRTELEQALTNRKYVTITSSNTSTDKVVDKNFNLTKFKAGFKPVRSNKK
jgi:antitoxin component of RelBE/YafQ-DinJ toxin-antitoxin module